MEIDNKNSEEKEAKQPAEIPEKEKDHVLRTAVILATVIIALGGIVVAVRLNNPKQDTTKGRKILSEMDRTPSIFLDFKMDFTSVSHSLSMDLSIEKVLREVPVMHWRVLPS